MQIANTDSLWPPTGHTHYAYATENKQTTHSPQRPAQIFSFIYDFNIKGERQGRGLKQVGWRRKHFLVV